MDSSQALNIIMSACAEYAQSYKDKPTVHESLVLRLNEAYAVLNAALMPSKELPKEQAL